MGQGAGQPAPQVEGQELHPPEGILHVVTEDPEVEHVPTQVQEARVEEHGGEEGVQLPSPRNQGGPHPVPDHQIAQGTGEVGPEEEGGVDGYEEEGEDRLPSGRVLVFEGNHSELSFLAPYYLIEEGKGGLGDMHFGLLRVEKTTFALLCRVVLWFGR